MKCEPAPMEVVLQRRVRELEKQNEQLRLESALDQAQIQMLKVLCGDRLPEGMPDAWKDGDDKPLPEDKEIDAAFPTRSGRHDLYGQAMRLVGATYTKGGLVALVTWLLLKSEGKR